MARTVLDLFRLRSPAPPPDPLGLMMCRRMPRDIEVARDRAIAQLVAQQQVKAVQSAAQRREITEHLLGLRTLGMVADTVIGDVRRKTNATAATIPYERDEVDSVPKTVAIKANELLGRYGEVLGGYGG